MNLQRLQMVHAAEIKSLIKEAGLTSEIVASKLKNPTGKTISKQRFSDMINGRRPQDLNNFAGQIAEIVDCRESEIQFQVR